MAVVCLSVSFFPSICTKLSEDWHSWTKTTQATSYNGPSFVSSF